MQEWYQENQPNLKSQVKVFSEMSFVIYSRKTRKYLNQNFFTESLPEMVRMKNYWSNFGKNIINIAKSNHIFPGKGREDKDFILTYLDSSMADVFLPVLLIFSILAFSARKQGRKLDQNCQLLVLPFSINTRILQKNFRQCFCLLEYHL